MSNLRKILAEEGLLTRSSSFGSPIEELVSEIVGDLRGNWDAYREDDWRGWNSGSYPVVGPDRNGKSAFVILRPSQDFDKLDRIEAYLKRKGYTVKRGSVPLRLLVN